jgi:hypothetical protein
MVLSLVDAGSNHYKQELTADWMDHLTTTICGRPALYNNFQRLGPDLFVSYHILLPGNHVDS